MLEKISNCVFASHVLYEDKLKLFIRIAAMRPPHGVDEDTRTLLRAYSEEAHCILILTSRCPSMIKEALSMVLRQARPKAAEAEQQMGASSSGSTSKATKATLRPGDKIFYWHQASDGPVSLGKVIMLGD